MTHRGKNIRRLDECPAEAIPDEVLSSTEPLLLRGLVAHWPVVMAARTSSWRAADYIADERRKGNL